MIYQTSPEIGGMGHSIKRKEDPRFIQGKGNYVDDVQLPDMVVWPHGAQSLCPRAAQEHQHRKSETASRRSGGDHRRRPGQGQPRLDAHPVLRQADGAGDRQGAVSSRRKWPSWSPRITTPPPMPPSWSKWNTKNCRCWWIRTRPLDPDAPILREDREAKDQPHLSLGSGRQGSDGQGISGRAGQGQGARSLSALPSRAARNLRLRCRLQYRDRAADHLSHVASASRASDSFLHCGRHSGTEYPRDLSRISAAASATRFPFIRDMSARWSRR